MKNKLFTKLVLISLFLATTNSFAQQIVKQWNIGVYTEEMSDIHPDNFWKTNIYRTSGDTIINNVEYQKLYKSSDSLFSDSTYYTGVRFDSNKIYQISYNQEKLLFDFNLEVGDTIFDFYYYYENILMVVADSVSSINLGGENLKQIFVTYYCKFNLNLSYNDVWVENIGSMSNGLLNNGCYCLTGCTDAHHLLCYKENDLLLYKNSHYNTCYKNTLPLEVEETKVDKYLIYPNPTSGILNLRGFSQNATTIKIHNTIGQQVYNKEVKPSTNKLQIDLNHLPKGLYFIDIGGFAMDKFIIE